MKMLLVSIILSTLVQIQTHAHGTTVLAGSATKLLIKHSDLFGRGIDNLSPELRDKILLATEKISIPKEDITPGRVMNRFKSVLGEDTEEFKRVEELFNKMKDNDVGMTLEEEVAYSEIFQALATRHRMFYGRRLLDEGLLDVIIGPIKSTDQLRRVLSGLKMEGELSLWRAFFESRQLHEIIRGNYRNEFWDYYKRADIVRDALKFMVEEGDAETIIYLGSNLVSRVETEIIRGWKNKAFYYDTRYGIHDHLDNIVDGLVQFIEKTAGLKEYDGDALVRVAQEVLPVWRNYPDKYEKMYQALMASGIDRVASVAQRDNLARLMQVGNKI